MSKQHKTQPVTFTLTDINALPDAPTITNKFMIVVTKSVAREMLGKTFKNWQNAKDSLMQCVYRHHGHMFDLCETQQIRGRNPFAKKAEHIESKRRFEVHHRYDCETHTDRMGDLNNLILLSPKEHRYIHSWD